MKARNLFIPQKDKPLTRQLVANLANGDDDEVNGSAVAELESTYMFRKVPHIPVPGHWLVTSPTPPQRLEWVLELLQKQRELHNQKLMLRKDPRISAAQPDTTFSDEDMKIIMNQWRDTPENWMQPAKFETLPGLSNKQRHQAIKSSFNAMKFQLLGNGALVDFFIRFNLFGAVQPGALTIFTTLAGVHANRCLLESKGGVRESPAPSRAKVQADLSSEGEGPACGAERQLDC